MGHSRIVEHYTDLLEKYDDLVAKHDAIVKRGEEGNSKSLKKDHACVAKSLSAELSVLRVERKGESKLWKREN